MNNGHKEESGEESGEKKEYQVSQEEEVTRQENPRSYWLGDLFARAGHRTR
jgi:hypothetical protein